MRKVKQQKQRQLVILAILGLSAIWQAPAYCLMGPEQLLQNLSEQKLVPGSAKAAIDVAGVTGIVSLTDDSGLATASDESLKTTAVSVAKMLMKSDNSVLTAKVRFFDASGSRYKEVRVSTGDISSHEKESDKAQLLASLAVTPGEMGGQQVAEALKMGRILGAGYADKIKADCGGAECVVSTYMNSGSRNPNQDCKIDAILLGKKVMDIRPATLRVKVYFYDAGGSGSREVSVTTGDIKAFASGQVRKEDLLKMVEIIDHAPPVRTETPKTTTTTTVAPTTTTSTAIDEGPKVQYAPQPLWAGGVYWYYPITWRQVPKDTEDRDQVARLENPRARALIAARVRRMLEEHGGRDREVDPVHWMKVRIEEQDSGPQYDVQEDRARWRKANRFYDGILTGLPDPGWIKMGRNKNIDGLSQIVEFQDANGYYRARLVYFKGHATTLHPEGCPTHIELCAPTDDWEQANADLEAVLKTVTIPR